MNYNPFLDTWFSNPWLSVGIPVLAFILFLYFSFKRTRKIKSGGKKQEKTKKEIKKEKRASTLFGALTFAIPMGLMILNGMLNPSYLGYGNSKRTVDVKFIDGKLFVTDYIRTMGGKTSSGVKYYRLHVIDPATGKKERRMLIGAGAELEFISGDKAFTSHYGDLWCFNYTTGKRTEIYSKKTLPKMFTQLAAGVDHFSLDSEKRLIKADGKDGLTWYINPITKTVMDSLPKNREHIPSDSLFLKQGTIQINTDYNGGDYLEVESKYNSSVGKREQIYYRNDYLLYKNESFITGGIAAMNIKDSSFVVVHYETTENEKFILSCFKMNGSKKLWEIKQRDLNAKYRFRNYKERPTFATDPANERIYFGIGGELFCVEMRDGKVTWRVKL